MLLSIVRCSDYRHYIRGGQHPIAVDRLNADVEQVGPVTGPSVSHMRNWGASHARGEWIFFVDEDCQVDIDKILTLIRKQKNKGDAISGCYLSSSKARLTQAYHRIQRVWLQKGVVSADKSEMHRANHLLGGALLVRREAFTAIGGFSTIIGWGAEELDFALRLQKKGFVTRLSYCLPVQHEKTLGLAGFLKRAWFQNRNRGLYNLKFANRKKCRLSYLKTHHRLLPYTLLFFIVGYSAHLYGSFVYGFKKMGAR